MKKCIVSIPGGVSAIWTSSSSSYGIRQVSMPFPPITTDCNWSGVKRRWKLCANSDSNTAIDSCRSSIADLLYSSISWGFFRCLWTMVPTFRYNLIFSIRDLSFGTVKLLYNWNASGISLKAERTRETSSSLVTCFATGLPCKPKHSPSYTSTFNAP